MVNSVMKDWEKRSHLEKESHSSRRRGHIVICSASGKFQEKFFAKALKKTLYENNSNF